MNDQPPAESAKPQRMPLAFLEEAIERHRSWSLIEHSDAATVEARSEVWIECPDGRLVPAVAIGTGAAEKLIIKSRGLLTDSNIAPYGMVRAPDNGESPFGVGFNWVASQAVDDDSTVTVGRLEELMREWAWKRASAEVWLEAYDGSLQPLKIVCRDFDAGILILSAAGKQVPNGRLEDASHHRNGTAAVDLACTTP